MNPYVIFAIAAFAGVSILVFTFFYINRTIKKENQRLEELSEDTSDSSQPSAELSQYIKVTVVDLYCGVDSVGKRTQNFFTVIFETDTHETLEYNVPEEMYDGFEKGQTGTLTVVDGYVYGFTLDEKN